MMMAILIGIVLSSLQWEGMTTTPAKMYCIPAGTKIVSSQAIPTCCSKMGSTKNGNYFCV